MKTIEIKNLITGYHQKNKEIYKVGNYPSLTLNKGDFVTLIGRNGIGKSTLLKTLSGDIPPIEGEVKINGTPIHQLDNITRSKLISFVLPNVQINGRLTVEEVVMLGRYPYINWWGKTSDDDKLSVIRALESVQAMHLKNRDITTLSDGEKQKVMIARALAQDTPIIFLDESTAHLDLPNRVEVFQLLKIIARKSQKTILLSTHEIEMSLQVADYIWLLQKGKCTFGTPDLLVSKNTIREVFNSNYVGFDKESGVFKFCSIEKQFSFGIELDVSVKDYLGHQDVDIRILWLIKKFISEGCDESIDADVQIKLLYSTDNELLEWNVTYKNKTLIYQDHDNLNLYNQINKDFFS
ncbi:ABC transporter ATP-binding protein [Flammeovirga sp. MY04]|uniref:ABC transporter ATP-binding protein n=1 Tax=Flammeovirga sp. MY04 TaxID=1191459 RepID=UPI00080615F5|nr:ABC transporter ATP-binding protein [Flammeovirga sp. MY04]ANQ48639.1 ABC transporter ATP-binding protein [Flammeovirga sp. MY04]